MQMPVQRLRYALGIAWSVLVWMVLVTLWSAAAIIPIIANVPPLYATVWIAFLMTVLLIKYALPPGGSIRERLGTVLRSPLPAQWRWIVPLGVATTMLNASFALLGEVSDSSAEAAIEAYAARPMGFVPLVLFMVVFAPFFEEFVLRGKILGLLRAPFGAHGAVFASAVLFATLHLGQSGGMLGRFWLGLVAGEAVLATGSLAGAIGVHAVNNALAVLGAWLGTRLPTSLADGAPSPSAAGVLVLGLAGAVGVIEAMRRLRAPAADPGPALNP